MHKTPSLPRIGGGRYHPTGYPYFQASLKLQKEEKPMQITNMRLGPGKCPDTLTETLYDMTLDGLADAETGDSVDWFYHVSMLNLSSDPLIVHETHGEQWEVLWVLVFEDSYGFVTYELQTSIEEMHRAFQDLDDKY